MIEIKHILCPTDFSEYAAYAAPYARELAKQFGAKVTLLHVMNIPEYVKGYYIPLDAAHVNKTMQETAEAELGALRERLLSEGVEVETAIATGSPSLEILNYCRDHGVDVVAIATHGRGYLAHMLMGSTVERVVRGAPCPVLTVRHPEHEFVHP